MQLGKKISIQQSVIEDTVGNITVSGFGWYDSKYTNDVKKRYLLEINIEKINDKNVTWKNCLNVIMFNPSEYGKERKDLFVDKTITNVIKIASDCKIANDCKKYNLIKVYNLFPKISAKPNITIDDKDKGNIDSIVKIPENSDILLAWGAILRDRQWINKIKNEICEKLNNRQLLVLDDKLTYPKHPGRMSISTIRNKYGDKQKVELKPYKFK